MNFGKLYLMNRAVRPMAIKESAFSALFMAMDIDENLDAFFGEKPIHYEDDDGVRVIHVNGIIDRGVPVAVARTYGIIDIDELRTILDESEEDESVKAIVLNIDSAGGCVGGVPELAERIAAINESKPIITHTTGMLCSAAYYLAASSSIITSEKSADIGSIGVYMPIYDFSGLYENAGIKVELVKTGNLKGAGFEGCEWTDEQKQHIQESVNDIFEDFKSFVLANRKIDATYMTGGAYVAKRAKEYGFIDEICELPQAITLAKTLINLKK